MFTLRFERYVAPARANAQIWRLVLGMLLIVALYLGGVALIFAGIRVFAGDAQTLRIATLVVEARTPTGMLVLFASFLGAAAGPVLAVRLLHKRAARTLFGSRVRVLHDFAVAAVAVLAVYSVLVALLSFWFEPIANLDFRLWLSLLPLTILGLLLQTGAEELVFRGYLQQQLAARFRSPVIWMLMPSLGFAILHYDPDTLGQNTWLIIGATGAFALIAADLTRITGSIGAAWGFHFANNVWALALLAVDGNLTGLALYITPYSADDTSLLPMLIGGDLLVMALVWIWLRRRLQR